MTPRQAYNIIVWLILLPLTIVVWAQFLPPCVFGCAQIQKTAMPSPSPNELGELKRYTVCGIAGPCWEVDGRPAPPEVCPVMPPCWRDGVPIRGSL
jgi:hypothetical protein